MEIDRYTDREIVQAILHRDTLITKEYLYRKCYPLFKSIHDKYYTDCENPIEFINEIYTYILWPHKETHKSKLQTFDSDLDDVSMVAACADVSLDLSLDGFLSDIIKANPLEGADISYDSSDDNNISDYE